MNQNVLPSPGALSTPMLAAHRRDQLAADRQAQPGAAVPPGGGGVGLREGLEQAAACPLPSMPIAGVGDLEADDDAAPPGRRPSTEARTHDLAATR